MNRSEVFDKIKEVFRTVLDDESLVINEDYSYDDIDDWDSLANIMIVDGIEKKLKIRFNLSDVQNWKNIGEMITAIEQKLELE